MSYTVCAGGGAVKWRVFNFHFHLKISYRILHQLQNYSFLRLTNGVESAFLRSLTILFPKQIAIAIFPDTFKTWNKWGWWWVGWFSKCHINLPHGCSAVVHLSRRTWPPGRTVKEGTPGDDDCISRGVPVAVPAIGGILNNYPMNRGKFCPPFFPPTCSHTLFVKLVQNERNRDDEKLSPRDVTPAVDVVKTTHDTADGGSCWGCGKCRKMLT